MDDDLKIVAAHLAAAMISDGRFYSVKGHPADNAAKTYFDVYDALTQARREHHKVALARLWRWSIGRFRVFI